MNSEIPYKYKYMLNKIINCIIEYITNNLNNHNLIESKLLLINNYILDVIQNKELTRNITTKKKFKKISISKTFRDKTVTPEYDKKINLSKFNNIFLNIRKNDINPKEINNPKSISSYNEKYKINKLKNLLKDEQEKSMLMELAYLKKLSFVQEKLNYYESKSNINNNLQQSTDDDKNIFYILTVRENAKEKMINKLTKNININTTMNNNKNKKKKFFENGVFSFDSKNIKHSMSISRIKYKTKNLDKSKHSFSLEKLNELMNNKNSFFKGSINGNIEIY
jgi:hypothetical protein